VTDTEKAARLPAGSGAWAATAIPVPVEVTLPI